MVKKIFFGSIASLLSTFSMLIASVVQSALAVRYLPKIDSGFWFLFLNMALLIAFCDFGLSSALSREIGFSSKKRNAVLRISNLFLTVQKVVYFISFIIGFCLFCFGYFYIYHLSLSSERIYHILYAFIIFGAGLIIRFQANPFFAVIYGIGDVASERLIKFIGPIIGCLIGFLLIFFTRLGLVGLSCGYAVQAVMIYALSFICFKKKMHISQKGRFLKKIIERIFGQCLQWTVMSIGALLIFQIGNFVISFFMGVVYVPQFAPLLQISTCVIYVATILGLVITPFVSKAQGQNNQELVRQLFTISVRFGTSISIVLAMFIYFFIDTIAKIWLGNNFAVNHSVLLVLLVTTILEVHHVSCATTAMAAGYIKFAVISIIAGLLNLILSVVFIHFLGIFGVALAILTAQLLTNNWYSVFVSLKHIKYTNNEYLINILFPLLKFVLYSIIVIQLILFILSSISIYVQLFIGLSVFGVLSCFGVWNILLKPYEKKFIKSKLLEIFHNKISKVFQE